MRSIFSFIISPKGDRYNNKKTIGNKTLILNTEMQNHNFVNRNSIVIETPIHNETNIQKGDEVIVHHNIFRRFYDVRGKQKNSASYFDEDKYFCEKEQIFLYKREKQWLAMDGFCFVKPLKNDDIFQGEKEQALKGVLKIAPKNLTDLNVSIGDIVGFTPNSEYEFIVDGERLYRVPINSISILYGHKGDETEYNPVWLQGS